ncbi:MAG TPA: hypothetical protein PLJ65_09180, partial [Casimicrobium sp.]|nr:hypothetical protein [Casimicrobium sp.]
KQAVESSLFWRYGWRDDLSADCGGDRFRRSGASGHKCNNCAHQQSITQLFRPMRERVHHVGSGVKVAVMSRNMRVNRSARL